MNKIYKSEYSQGIITLTYYSYYYYNFLKYFQILTHLLPSYAWETGYHRPCFIFNRYVQCCISLMYKLCIK